MSTTGIDQTLAALADPSRRAVVELLRRKPQRAGEIARALAMSPPGLSRHLRVLRLAGLVTDDGDAHDARVSVYRLKPEAFKDLNEWLNEAHAESRTSRRRS